MSTLFSVLCIRAEILFDDIAPGRCTLDSERHELAIVGNGPLGIDLRIVHDAEERVVHLGTNRGYHDHFHVDQFDSEIAAIEVILDIAQALMTGKMRILDTYAGRTPRKSELQHLDGDRWITRSTSGLLFWNFFARRSQVVYSN